MILIDTGPIVASFNKDDTHHNICLDVLKNIKAPLITTVPVLTEAFYLLGYSWHLQDNLWEAIGHETLQIYKMDRAILKRCHELMKKYQDLPMDLADASLVAVADAENIRTIFTLDHKDFKVYRTKQKRHFKLLPSEFK